MAEKHLDLWGENMEIRHSESLHIEGNDFPMHEVTASDDTNAIVMISSELITKDTNDVRSLIEHTLAERGLHAIFVNSDNHLFLESVSPLDEEIMRRFRGQGAGVIALVNGHEPGEGSHALDEMTLHKGDTLELLYRIGSEVRENGVTGRDSSLRFGQIEDYRSIL